MVTTELRVSSYAAEVMEEVRSRNPGEAEFQQAVQEVFESLELVLQKRPQYRKARILERMVEPERVVMFRVPWQDDEGRSGNGEQDAESEPTAAISANLQQFGQEQHQRKESAEAKVAEAGGGGFLGSD